jgi:hypothetical protein
MKSMVVRRHVRLVCTVTSLLELTVRRTSEVHRYSTDEAFNTSNYPSSLLGLPPVYENLWAMKSAIQKPTVPWNTYLHHFKATNRSPFKATYLSPFKATYLP